MDCEIKAIISARMAHTMVVNKKVVKDQVNKCIYWILASSYHNALVRWHVLDHIRKKPTRMEKMLNNVD